MKLSDMGDAKKKKYFGHAHKQMDGLMTDNQADWTI